MTLGYCGSFRTRLLPDPGLMPGRSQHPLSADRFESFAAHIAPQHLEWLVIVWFHIALHYVDAFLAVQGHEQIAGHSDRWAKMANSLETRAVRIEFEQRGRSTTACEAPCVRRWAYKRINSRRRPAPR